MGDDSSSSGFDALLQEDRQFPPSEELRARAHANDPEIYARAARDREGFWASWAEQLDWETKWDRVLEWNPPYARWFV
ncbi:MAG: acetyl-coenzyme synthetase, partial [Acidobacteria bacterium]|nr:acetyl-coenzyme synthetase [Acidobacteriota bacterium]